MTPLREVWAIAWPTVLTMTSFTVMQFFDKLMVGQVGPLEVAAQGNAGIWSFTPIAIAYGIITIVNTFVAQNLGAGRPREAPRYAWSAAWVALTIYVLAFVPLSFFLPQIFRAMHVGERIVELERLIELESAYARILLLGGLFTMLSRSLHQYFFGLHRPKVATVSAIIGNATNVVGNFILIFGEAGLPSLGLPGIPGVPAMGLTGAAIATVIGTVVELSVPLLVFFGPKMNAELGTRASWKPDGKAIKDLFRVGWPGSLMTGNELICWAIFMTVLVGRFGEQHMAAGWIALGYMHLSFMPAVGFSVAATSLVGRYMGAGQPDLARRRAHLCLRMAVSYMTLCAIIFLLFRHALIGLFVGGAQTTPELEAEIIAIGARLLICAALFQTADSVGIVYIGALRGAGDTVWPGVLATVLSWTVIVGLGWFLAARLPELESVGPWIAASLYIIALGIAMAVRFERGKWRDIKLVDRHV